MGCCAESCRWLCQLYELACIVIVAARDPRMMPELNPASHPRATPRRPRVSVDAANGAGHAVPLRKTTLIIGAPSLINFVQAI